MPIFRIKNSKILPIQEKEFNLEKDLQKLIENNLGDLFGLEFVATEFNIESFWLDTVAFDKITNSFVILEYKKAENFSLMDQGQTYLNLLLDHKAEIILEYNERLDKSLKRSEIDWSQTRVIFVGPKFNTYQKRALSLDLPFELWEVSLYEDGLLSLNSINPIAMQRGTKRQKTSLSGKAAKEIKTYTLENHYVKMSSSTKDLFEELRERILTIDPNIKEVPVQNYVGYKLSWYNFVAVHAFKSKLKVYLRKERFDKDSSKQLTKVPKSYKWGKTPLWWINIKSDKTIDYLMPIIRESYEAAPDK